ncbi:MAG: autotransporter domain-containing protein, partial [Alphaproteobacteria bacterium]|nr:autotransporter domain-containing protein [Alphaproteobacteria bacterium]
TAGAEGGAIVSDAILNVTGSAFEGNQTTGTVIGVNSTDSNEGGGAIFMYDDSVATITNSTFTSNESGTWGGAISTRGISSAQPGANSSLAVNGGTFTANNAVYGGAVANSLRNTVGEGNVVTKYGARINGVTFTGNTATTNGGAIYNVGDITLAGTNTFTGNTANGLANDIHNVGALTVESGTTTMDGGITGGGTLSIANGATLNIGTATVEQGTITLDGNMLATLRDGDAQITAGTFDGDGTLKLSFAGEGTYHVFGGGVFALAKDQVTSSIYDLTWDNSDKDLIVTLKSVEDIAAENGIQEDTAAAVAGASQSTSEKLNDLSVKIQEKLAEATPAAKQEVEHAVKAVHPEAGSVVQSVSTAVQTTVSNLVAARMAAPISGRNGGDMNFTSGGVWAQGLFNKSKQNDAFSGYTRGIAAGMDGTINRAWTIGAGYSFAHSDISGSVRDTEIDSNTVFVYGQYKPDALYVSAIANYTWADYSEEGIAMGTPVTGDYNVDSFGGMLAAGYDFDTGITPEVGLRYLHVNGEDYTNSMDVKSKLDSADYLTASLGAKYGFGLLTDSGLLFRPELRAAAKYDLMSDKTTATVLM